MADTQPSRAETSGKRAAYSSRISCTPVTAFAPHLIRLLTPCETGLFNPHGTANTSRFCSSAVWAVISDPLLLAASTTSTPAQSPEISRLRMGKFPLEGGVLTGYSEITAPAWAIASRSEAFSIKYA